MGPKQNQITSKTAPTEGLTDLKRAPGAKTRRAIGAILRSARRLQRNNNNNKLYLPLPLLFLSIDKHKKKKGNLFQLQALPLPSSDSARLSKQMEGAKTNERGLSYTKNISINLSYQPMRRRGRMEGMHK